MSSVLKADGTELSRHIDGMNEEQKAELAKKFETVESVDFELEIKGEKKIVTLQKTFITFKFKEQMQQEEKYIPYVIEPSFGIGRIFTAILEHNFHMRDKKRTFLSLPPKIAPIKCSILPLISSEKFEATIHNLKVNLNKVGVSSKVDDSGNSIGKRYARTDELGIPFGITIDPETLEDKSVTLREILTTKQIRIPVKITNKYPKKKQIVFHFYSNNQHFLINFLKYFIPFIITNSSYFLIKSLTKLSENYKTFLMASRLGSRHYQSILFSCLQSHKSEE